MIFSQFNPDENNDVEIDEVMDILRKLRVPQNELDLFRTDCQSTDRTKINRNTFINKFVEK